MFEFKSLLLAHSSPQEKKKKLLQKMYNKKHKLQTGTTIKYILTCFCTAFK